jgi:hypothetical protein
MEDQMQNKFEIVNVAGEAAASPLGKRFEPCGFVMGAILAVGGIS